MSPFESVTGKYLVVIALQERQSCLIGLESERAIVDKEPPFTANYGFCVSWSVKMP